MKKKYNCVIWDFNGTILDDLETGIKSANLLLSKRKMKTVSGQEEYRELFGFPIIDYYRRLGYTFEDESFDVIAAEWVEAYLRYEKNAGLCCGALEGIKRLKERGVKQALISATEINMLNCQLEQRGLAGYFDDIRGLDNIHASGKSSLIARYLCENCGYNAVMIGDTDHDYESAHMANTDCILVESGHQNAKKLASTGAPVFENAGKAVEYLIKNNLV